MSITKIAMLLLLLSAAANSSVLNFTPEEDADSFPEWLTGCANLVFTHSFKTSICEKQSDGAIVLKTPKLSTPLEVKTSSANSS